jgi:FAD/FMN-containing dehydrogenase
MNILEQYQEANLSTVVLVNDQHSGLNATFVSSVLTPRNERELVELVQGAHRSNQQIAITGGRHAMGGQQFLSGGLLIDMTSMNNVIRFDKENGLLEVESGITWPELIFFLKAGQATGAVQWTIAQKQTGCDRLSIGGALSSNVHGRGLTKAPIVSDVEEFTIVLHDGSVQRCNRKTNRELFGLAIGGYGLFGIISSVTLRLVPLVTLKRTVETCSSAEAVQRLEDRQKNGATYGDFQFAIDHSSPDFLISGILSTYAPVESKLDNSCNKLLKVEQWEELLFLAHADKTAAFEGYKRHYLSTNGQLYSSDTFQLATYIDGYHKKLDERLSSSCPGSEAITELYVPRSMLGSFMRQAASQLRREQANVIYGTVRLIEEENETFLPWASHSWACIIFNLHVDHNPEAIAAVSKTFRNLIQLAIDCGGKYYLTYNRFASASQLQQCYPEIAEFVQQKQKYDPESRFKSDWYDYVLDCVTTRSGSPATNSIDRSVAKISPATPKQGDSVI